MSRIRIAQLAYLEHAGRTFPSARTCGVDLMWVELDGVRITDVISAQVEIAAADTVPELIIRPFGSIEIVYLDPDGLEIGGREVDPRELAGNLYDHGVAHDLPARTDLDEVVRQRDRALARVAELEQQQAQERQFLRGAAAP